MFFICLYRCKARNNIQFEFDWSLAIYHSLAQWGVFIAEKSQK